MVKEFFMWWKSIHNSLICRLVKLDACDRRDPIIERCNSRKSVWKRILTVIHHASTDDSYLNEFVAIVNN